MTRIEVVRAVAPAAVQVQETRRSRRENTRRKLLDQEMEKKFPTLRDFMHSFVLDKKGGSRGSMVLLGNFWTL
jgi:hypothetical protein